MIDEKKLDFWAEEGLNVLFNGRHGVGKTSMVIAAFEKAGLNWRYFSAATMDPWVDFIGVPKEQTDKDGPFLELVLPQSFRDDKVEALFFDEFNRSHKKVRNAVMELIQFKSINGRPFRNLKMVWAAINPDDEDDTYDVEKLDPAQIDRFHVHCEIPYEISIPYFSRKYSSRIAKVANDWWLAQAEEIRDLISPRRLDYTIQHFDRHGDLRDILPEGANVSALQEKLTKVATEDKLFAFLNTNDKVGAQEWLKDANNLAATLPYIEKPGTGPFASWVSAGENKFWQFFLPLLPDENFSALYHSHRDIRAYVVSSMESEFETFLADKSLVDLAADSGKAFHAEDPKHWEPTQFVNEIDSWIERLAVASTVSLKTEILSEVAMRFPHNIDAEGVKKTFRLLEQFGRRGMPSTIKSHMTALLPLTNTMIVLYYERTKQRSWDHLAPVLHKRLAHAYGNDALYKVPAGGMV
jgi:MoxR-like ATPase